MRPGILAETAARIRATTYPLAVTEVAPAGAPALPPPEIGVATIVCTVGADLPRA